MSTNSMPRAVSGRVIGLDGLRGAAALVVVLLHSLLLIPEFADAFYSPRTTDLTGTAWLFTFTPLHILWDGSAAVFVFFVLSGFVLTLPFAAGPRNWAAYYPSRLVRLYVPVWGAIAFAVVAAFVIPRLQEGSRWVSAHRTPGVEGVLRDLVLIAGAPGATNSALWSLRWEVLFSLALPLFIAFAVLLRRAAIAKILLLLAACFVGAVMGGADYAPGFPALFQLPIFAIGCVLAVEWPRLSDLTRRLLCSRLRVVAAAIVVALAISAYWIVRGLSAGRDPLLLLAATRVLAVAGAACVVVMVGALPAWGSALSTRPLAWLGARSFSLYLVHEPVVAAVGKTIPIGPTPLLAIAVAVTVSLVAAELFFRLVERPSHRLSRAVSRRIKRSQALRSGASSTA